MAFDLKRQICFDIQRVWRCKSREIEFLLLFNFRPSFNLRLVASVVHLYPLKNVF
jgi:hypothetical protein